MSFNFSSKVENKVFEFSGQKSISTNIPYITVDNFPKLGFITALRFIEWLNENKPQWKTFEARDKTRLRLLKMNQGNETIPPKSSVWIGFELKRTMLVKETFTPSLSSPR